MSKILARFYVSEVAHQAGGTYGRVTMNAVKRKTDDNVNWASATPSGQFTMTVHEEALKTFHELLGKDVEISIAPFPESE